MLVKKQATLKPNTIWMFFTLRSNNDHYLTNEANLLNVVKLSQLWKLSLSMKRGYTVRQAFTFPFHYLSLIL